MLGLFFDAYRNETATSEPCWTQALQNWAMPSWDWAQAYDRFEYTLANVPVLANRAMLTGMEAMVDLQLEFLRRRFHANCDCVNSMLACEDPEEAVNVATDYWRQFVGDCEKQSKDVLAAIADGADRTCVTEAAGDTGQRRRRTARRKTPDGTVIPLDRAVSAPARDKAA
ncbi:phasin family protein [Stappia sp. F7233]|uniref:Phasin family protein n=1 Tax=Stappia albiluteola TaxID=2758565 RepID=A0A839AI12_9HYPH|nr:phasin family protein [Stappia albiluteola]MBA5778716.1 phasin family protein [Stappia albiluteola]